MAADDIPAIGLGPTGQTKFVMVVPEMGQPAATNALMRLSQGLALMARMPNQTFDVVDAVPAQAELVRTETFGPVLAVRCFDDPDAVIAEVNAGAYGLQAGLFTNDHALVKRVARQLRVGGVMVNEGPDFRAENVPFGGIKSSGLGREGIHMTLREMSETKVVID